MRHDLGQRKWAIDSLRGASGTRLFPHPQNSGPSLEKSDRISMCARNYFRYLRLRWITLLFIKRKLGGDVSSCCQGCGLLCVLVSRDVSRHSTEQLSSHRHRQVVGPLPRIPSFTINKDPEICDPESHKTRDLERLIVSPEAASQTPWYF